MSTWYEQAVFYHIYPLGLTGAPKANPINPDGEAKMNPPVPAGEAGGTAPSGFSELEQWIPHMERLNCSALYIGPLFESSSHGYDTRDYRLADRRLGTNGEFQAFVGHCHEAGIRVVVDGVFNHTGREFFAFRDIANRRESSPYRDWYRGVNFGWGSPMGDSFGYEAWQGHYELPCLNLQNPAVREYLFETVQFWIDSFQIDGIRLDCANVLDFGFMQELRARTGRMKQDFWLMGEVIHGEYGRWANPDTLHSVTNYELHKALYSGHNDHNYFEIAHSVRRLDAVGRGLYLFADNHDEDRIASKLINKDHLKPVYQLLFTLPGIPSVYYGSEWGIEGKRSKTSDEVLRPAIRLADMPAASGTDAIQGHARELASYISALAKLHRDNPELNGGRYQELLLTNRQYAFCRHGDGSIVLSAVNNDDAECSVTIPVPIPAKSAKNLMNGSEAAVTDGKLTVTLPANGGFIFKILEG